MNNTDTDNAQDIDIVVPMYNLIEYSNNYKAFANNSSTDIK